ncbi:MAG: glycosyl hydrolase [Reichenbachiella sp.]
MKNIFLVIVLLITFSSYAQKRKKGSTEPSSTIIQKTNFSGLKFRSVGPALTSGRISDFAVNPDNPSEYYVASSSGGVWKTINSGNTFEPIFDSQGSYSIGCVTMDPNNSNVVWVGTGENNGQRSVAYGDGIYKSVDGGKSWEHKGLKNSEHIGNILIDPRDSNVIYVSAIGPLWSAGGDRGLYKSTDGGDTWNKILNIDQHTGVNEVVADPRNPDVLYASSYQRRRHVFTYLGGGPGSGIHKSVDAGKTWSKINNGLPEVDLGRIGLAISPANPEYIYAIVEAAQKEGGFYRSNNRGASWEKRGKYVTSGNYYQEIIADPIDAEKVYAMDTWMHVTIDGGKTFQKVGEVSKHVDNHCIWINPKNNAHLLVGCDGGIYETWDNGKNWDFKANLPVIQFYKVAVDNAEPFYNIYGGTQDNFSLGGPSRTVSGNGPNNLDWIITHGGDGFESQIDPTNPDIVYAQSQYGHLARYDRKSGEEIGIQPKERKDENAYRWNWDAPLAVSNHKDSRIYFAANKLFKSDDRGDSWEVISDDLTRALDRNKLKVMDRIWSVDAVAKNGSTSPFGTIVAFSESPKNENLLFVGTDDGLIQVSENGGQNWRKIDNIPGVPKMTYVNAIFASKHDENVVYAAFNHHKYGDFKPYIFRSVDKGRTWSSISSNLPKRGSVYSIEEDHVDANLIFVGTEFGCYFSDNQGGEWKQLKAGLPTIAVRDLTIHPKHNDLILGTFGRGFFVLDDYSSLRNISSKLNTEAQLFSVRDALIFEPSWPLGLPNKSFQGDNFFIGDNLGSEAIFTWYLKDEIKTKEDQRVKTEKESAKNGNDNYFPSYAQLESESKEEKPSLIFTVKDSEGNIVRKLISDTKAGVQRINWDLKYSPKGPVDLSKASFYNPWASKNEGNLVSPGKYSVSLSKLVDGEESQLGEAVSFNLSALNNATLPTGDRMALTEFQNKVKLLSGRVDGASKAIDELKSEMKYMKVAIDRTPQNQGELFKDYNNIKNALGDIEKVLFGDPIAAKLDMGQKPSVASRIGYIDYEQGYSTSKPTQTHQDSFAIAKGDFEPAYEQLKKLLEGPVADFRKKLKEAGAPYTPGNLNFLD